MDSNQGEIMSLPTVFANYSDKELVLMVDNMRAATPMERELADRIDNILKEAEDDSRSKDKATC